MVIEGIDTTLPLFDALLDAEGVQTGDYTIHWLEKWLDAQG
jgi:acetyl-CoA carboxylase biotin carboxylase subunit